MKSDIAKSERLGMYGRGIERIKLKKAAGIMQKNWKGNMDTVEIGGSDVYPALRLSRFILIMELMLDYCAKIRL